MPINETYNMIYRLEHVCPWRKIQQIRIGKYFTRVAQRVPLIEQELLTIPEYLSSPRS